MAGASALQSENSGSTMRNHSMSAAGSRPHLPSNVWHYFFEYCNPLSYLPTASTKGSGNVARLQIRARGDGASLQGRGGKVGDENRVVMAMFVLS